MIKTPVKLISMSFLFLNVSSRELFCSLLIARHTWPNTYKHQNHQLSAPGLQSTNHPFAPSDVYRRAALVHLTENQLYFYIKFIISFDA